MGHSKPEPSLGLSTKCTRETYFFRPKLSAFFVEIGFKKIHGTHFEKWPKFGEKWPKNTVLSKLQAKFQKLLVKRHWPSTLYTAKA